MSELPNDPTPTTPPPAETPPQPNGGNQGESDPSWLPARLQRAEENARKQLLVEMGVENPAQAKQWLADYRKRQQDEMTELQKAQARIAELETKAQRADAAEAALKETVLKRIEALPKDMRALVPDYDDPAKTLLWLDKYAEKLQRPTAPNLDAGVTGDSKQSLQLTPEELDLAQKAGMKPEDFAKYKARGKPEGAR